MKRTPTSVRPSHPSRQARRGVARAFTLIELLIVITIIGLLVSILLPAYSQINLMAKGMATQTFVEALNGGAVMYKKAHGIYPGQDVATFADLASGGASGQLTGSKLLAMRLFGLRTDGRPLANATVYASHKEDALFDFGQATDSIIDTFSGTEMPLLYYPARAAQNPQYIFQDNSFYFEYDGGNLRSGLTTTQCEDAFESYVKSDANGPNRGRPYRDGEFLIIGAGKDRAYFTADDNRNFVR